MSGRKMGIEWANLANPLPDLLTKQIKGQQSKEIEPFEPIPYAVSGLGAGDSLLWFLYNMAILSSTRGTCINQISKYSASKPTFLRPGNIFADNTELSEDEKNKIIDFISKNEIDIQSIGEEVIRQYKIAGCCYVGLVMTETLGIKSIKLQIFDNRSIRLLKEKSGEPEMLSDGYKDEKEIGRLFYKHPHFSIDNTKTMRTFVKVGGTGYWGRPDALQAFMHWYREWQDANFLMVQSENKFMPQVFIESEMFDPDTHLKLNEYAKEKGFDSYTDMINKELTIKAGGNNTIMHHLRPMNSKESLIYEFKPNLNEKFYETTNNISREKIIESEGWSEKLLGKAVSGIGQSGLLEELKAKQPLLNRYRSDVSKQLSKLIHMAMSFLDYNIGPIELKYIENVTTNTEGSSESSI